MRVIYSGGGTPLSVVRACEIGVTSNMGLDMCGSPILTIFYLLKGKRGVDLESKSLD